MTQEIGDKRVLIDSPANTIVDGDLFFYPTPNGGTIEVWSGIATMHAGFEVAIYLSLFGGNPEDDGRSENEFQYWANFMETDPARRLRSQTQNVLQGLPAVSGNLVRVEEAVRADLAWMLGLGIADDVFVQVSIPKLNWVRIKVVVQKDSETVEVEFVETWRAQTS